MQTEHLKAALGLTAIVGVGAAVFSVAMFQLVPVGVAVLLSAAGALFGGVYLARLWMRHYYFRKSVAAFRAAALDSDSDSFYVEGSMKTILRDEPVLYAALLHYAHEQRFNGYVMCDQAAPAFVGQGFSDAAGTHVLGLVEVLLPVLEEPSPVWGQWEVKLPCEEKQVAARRRDIVTKVVAAARSHGARTTFAYVSGLGVEAGLSAMEQGLPLEYAKALA